MKIVHVCLNGIVTDGWDYQDNLLPKYQKKHNNDVIMITSQWIYNKSGKIEKTDKDEYLNENGIKTYRIPLKHGNVFSKLKTYNGLYELLLKENPDIVFLHDFQCLDSLKVVKYVKKNKNVVLYCDNHADFTNSATNFLSKKVLHGIIWKFIARKLKPYTKKFYGVLPARVDFLTKVYKLPSTKCELLLMGVDDELANECLTKESINDVKKRYKIDETDFLFVTGGKIDKWKTDTLKLMEAIKELRELKAKLIVFGSVSDEIKESFFKLVDNDTVMYVGWLDSTESMKILAASDAAVFPGRHSVFWEKSAGLGKPIFCKKIPGTNHININGNCVFFEENTIEEYKRLLSQYVCDKEINSEMKKNAILAKNFFSYYKIAEESLK